MGLFLYNHYYDKQDALKVLQCMKYYTRNLEQIDCDEDLAKGLGIIGYMKVYEEKMHEDYLVDKLRIVRGILEKKGNDAIDAYQELTSPSNSHSLSPLIKLFERSNDNGFAEIISELTIPMKKDEFEHYLDIYNQFYTKQPS